MGSVLAVAVEIGWCPDESALSDSREAKDMNEMKDWIWIAVAGIWIVMRVLPRLFKSRDQGAKTVEAPKTAASGAPVQRRQIPKWATGGFSPTSPSSPGNETPPPIEPR